jgi:predicted HicB family RNase H-like nuclease
MGENATKAVAFRIPMSDYLRFVQDAKNSNMVFSDWLLLRVYAEDKSQQLTQTNTVLNQSISGYENEIESLKEELKKKNETILGLENNNNYLKQETTLLQEETSHYKEEYQKCRKELEESRKTFTGENVLKYHRAVSEYQDILKELSDLLKQKDYQKMDDIIYEALRKKVK